MLTFHSRQLLLMLKTNWILIVSVVINFKWQRANFRIVIDSASNGECINAVVYFQEYVPVIGNRFFCSFIKWKTHSSC